MISPTAEYERGGRAMHASSHTTPLRLLVAVGLLLACVSQASAQLVLPYVPELDDVPTALFSYASFIDSAVPMSTVRVRVEGAYDSNRPTRGEFFMAPEGSRFRGLPIPERRVDYQEVHTYAEYAFWPQLSIFLDVPDRFLNPEFNRNHSGLSDIQFGGKWAFYQQGPITSTLQVRVTAPTGDSTQGLGNGHGSLEPGFLLLYQPDARWRIEAECLGWLPLDDERYGSEIIRYGLSMSYGERDPESFWFTPVSEIQGWSLVRGMETVAESPTRSQIVRTLGNTIVNGNLGVRAGFGTCGDVFVGYSRAMTGQVWYKDLWRIELRYFY